MDDEVIDWPLWLALPEVKAWEAIALTLSIDPKKIHRSPEGNREDPEASFLFEGRQPRNHVIEEFKKRIKLFLAARSDRPYFQDGTIIVGAPADNGVKLTQMVRWLNSIERSPVAEELLSAAETSIAAEKLSSAMSSIDEQTTEPERMKAWQEDQVRRAILALGYNPLALPADDRRRNFFVKALVRERCSKNHATKMRKAIFDKTWDRMLTREPRGLKYT